MISETLQTGIIEFGMYGPWGFHDTFQVRAEFMNGRMLNEWMPDLFVCACKCCSYRQRVKGEASKNGTNISHPLEPGVLMSDSEFQEDAIVTLERSWIQILRGRLGLWPAFPDITKVWKYGYRDNSQFASLSSANLGSGWDDYCNPDRPTGCSYVMRDTPGMNKVEDLPNMAPARLTWKYDFEGVIVDTCLGGIEADRIEWTTKGDYVA